MIRTLISSNLSTLSAMLLFLLLSACANVNPYSISNDSFATLKNWSEDRNGAYFSIFFNHADEHYLYWGLIGARNKAHFKIKPGPRKLIIHIVYAPRGIWSFGSSLSLQEAFIKIEINAKEGKTYRANAVINENLMAEIWVEEVGGKKVSGTVKKSLSSQIDRYNIITN